MTHCEWVKPMAEHQEYPRLNHPVIVLYDAAEGELKGIVIGEITCAELPDNIAVTGLRTAATSAAGTVTVSANEPPTSAATREPTAISTPGPAPTTSPTHSSPSNSSAG